MRTINFILLAAVIGLGVLAGQQAATLKEQQTRLVAAEERIKAASLAQQERCSNEAQKWFARQQYSVNDLASYHNHFSVKLEKCMIDVESKFFGKGVVIEFERIVDVFENRQVGTFVNQNGRLTHCNVTSPSGQLLKCNDSVEFDKLSTSYMQG